MEHGGASIETLRMLGGRLAGTVTGAVRARASHRVPLHGAGAGRRHCPGLMLPMVEDAAQARRSSTQATATRRSAGAAPAWAWRRTTTSVAATSDKVEALNARTFVIAQIESPSGLENLDAIARVDGIDCLWVGHNDLSIQMGIPGHFQSNAFQDAIKRVADAADRHGLAAGVMVGDLAGAERWMSQGLSRHRLWRGLPSVRRRAGTGFRGADAGRCLTGSLSHRVTLVSVGHRAGDQQAVRSGTYGWGGAAASRSARRRRRHNAGAVACRVSGPAVRFVNTAEAYENEAMPRADCCPRRTPG